MLELQILCCICYLWVAACVIHELLNTNQQPFSESRFRQTLYRWAAQALCSAVVLWHQLTADLRPQILRLSFSTQMAPLGFSRQCSRDFSSPGLLCCHEVELNVKHSLVRKGPVLCRHRQSSMALLVIEPGFRTSSAPPAQICPNSCRITSSEK